ncbi:MAG: hypothetical protein LBE09_07510, partial [Christensenellaceae bacterium]|nr:hypothetical protein [Christensenellaceae bacterium]
DLLVDSRKINKNKFCIKTVFQFILSVLKFYLIKLSKKPSSKDDIAKCIANWYDFVCIFLSIPYLLTSIFEQKMEVNISFNV